MTDATSRAGESRVLGEPGDKGVAAQASSATPILRFDHVTKRFADFTAVDDVTLDIQEGEFFALLGPSGCGKSTLLRLLAGFETPSGGRVILAGRDVGAVPPYRRPVNMMFQSYALFPHLTVAGNVAFGLRQERLSKSAIKARVAEMLNLVKLEHMADRRPDQLSGGERQRVALARALAKQPRVLLLDEPMAALDKKLREATQFELIDLQARLGTTFVIVTHDQQEAMTVADRLAVMAQGRIIQVATPAEIYEQPISRYVAEFVGDVNMIEGGLTTAEPSGSLIDSARVGSIRVIEHAGALPGATVWLALRPEKIQITHEASSAAENCFFGRVLDIAYLGNLSTYKVALDKGAIMKATVANMTRSIERPIGRDDRVVLSWPANAGVVLTG